MTVFVLAVTAANFRKQIRAAPAKKGSDCKPKPHSNFSLSFFSIFGYQSAEISVGGGRN
jgi:hypothetical protein